MNIILEYVYDFDRLKWIFIYIDIYFNQMRDSYSPNDMCMYILNVSVKHHLPEDEVIYF